MKIKNTKKTFIGIMIILVVIGLIIGGIALFNYLNYQKTYEYKLSKIGYSEKEIEEIESKLKNTTIDSLLLTSTYNSNILSYINYKYFIEENLSRYIHYQNENQKEDPIMVIRIVNVNGDLAPYTNTSSSDLEKEYLILVNKYNYLEENHEIPNLEDISLMYAYSNNRLQEEAVTNYVKMARAAKENGLSIIVNSSYRTYEEQEKIYNSFYKQYGEEYAEEYSAHAGFSEHETGLAVDIDTYHSTSASFEESEEFAWLTEHCYEYGYILRYPEGLEKITGYLYEPWHYRYVGIEAAKQIKEESITFDEYYQYYVK